MEHDNSIQKEEELHMNNRVPERLKEVAEKMENVGRTEYGVIRRPRWKEYTLVKYKGKKVVSREKIWIDESRVFSSDEDFFWEPKADKMANEAA